MKELSGLETAVGSPSVTVRKLVIILSGAEPLEFPVVGDEEAEKLFFKELRARQFDEVTSPEFDSALADLLQMEVYIRPNHIISAFCFDDELGEQRPPLQ